MSLTLNNVEYGNIELFQNQDYKNKIKQDSDFLAKHSESLNKNPNYNSKDQEAKNKTTHERHPLMHLLHEHLTNEMFDEILNMFESPHLVLKVFLGLFLLCSYALAAFYSVDIMLLFFNMM